MVIMPIFACQTNIIKVIDYENNDCRCDYDRNYLHNFSM